MAVILNEGFEAAGYDAAGWTEGVDGGSTVNEDENTVNAGSPPLWGSQCLLIDRIASTNSYTFNVPGATVITFTAVEVKLSAVSLASDGDFNLLFTGLDVTLATALWIVRLRREAGVTLIEVTRSSDGIILWVEPLSLNKLYRFEVKWDTTADTYALWVNGILFGADVLTGGDATTPVGAVLIGDTNVRPGAYTARFDRLVVDNSTHIGPDALGPGGMRSGRPRLLLALDAEDEGRFNEVDVRNWW